MSSDDSLVAHATTKLRIHSIYQIQRTTLLTFAAHRASATIDTLVWPVTHQPPVSAVSGTREPPLLSSVIDNPQPWRVERRRSLSTNESSTRYAVQAASALSWAHDELTDYGTLDC
jgi:hypothetical protein